MNILCVYPEYPDTFWSFKHVLRFVAKKATFPPLGLLTVAAMLPEEWNKRLVDLNVRKLKDKDIAWADLVFISAMIIQKESAQGIIDRCKALNKTVVAGGPAFTTQHEAFHNVDHFVLNEAEITLPLFLADLERGEAKKVYTSPIRPSITHTPIPLWSLIRFKDYVAIPVQYSRGCPYNCEFCDIIVMNGRHPRTKSTEQVMAEFQSLYDAGWRGSVFIVDDNFIGNKVNVKQMLPRFIEWQEARKFPFYLFTEASVNLADDAELLKLMSAANFFKVFLGIETPAEDGLKECGKYQNTRRDLADAVKRIQMSGMQVMGGFIVGFDSDTEGIFEAQMRFIQQSGVVTAMVGMLTALPETRLWHRLKKEGRLLTEATGENTDGSLNFIPHMDKERLIQGYRKILSTIYSHKVYYERIHTFLKDYEPTVRAKLSRADIRAFVRSMWRIGIFSSARVQYWKLVIRTFFTKRRAFPVAIELAICGLHFQKIVKRSYRFNRAIG